MKQLFLALALIFMSVPSYAEQIIEIPHKIRCGQKEHFLAMIKNESMRLLAFNKQNDENEVTYGLLYVSESGKYLAAHYFPNVNGVCVFRIEDNAIFFPKRLPSELLEFDGKKSNSL